MSDLVKCPRCTNLLLRNWCYLCDKEGVVSAELAAAYRLLKQSGSIDTAFDAYGTSKQICKLRVDVGDLIVEPGDLETWRNWFYPKSQGIRRRKKKNLVGANEIDR